MATFSATAPAYAPELDAPDLRALVDPERREEGLRAYRVLLERIDTGAYREAAASLSPFMLRAPDAPLVSKLAAALAKALVSDHVGNGPEGRLFAGLLLCIGAYSPGRDGAVAWLAPTLAEQGGIWELVREDLLARLALAEREHRDAPRVILHERLARVLADALCGRRSVMDKLLGDEDGTIVRQQLAAQLGVPERNRRVLDMLRRCLREQDLLVMVKDAHSRGSHPLAQPGAERMNAEQLTTTVHSLIAAHVRRQLQL